MSFDLLHRDDTTHQYGRDKSATRRSTSASSGLSGRPHHPDLQPRRETRALNAEGADASQSQPRGATCGGHGNTMQTDVGHFSILTTCAASRRHCTRSTQQPIFIFPTRTGGSHTQSVTITPLEAKTASCADSGPRKQVNNGPNECQDEKVLRVIRNIAVHRRGRDGTREISHLRIPNQWTEEAET